jgi:hypothetical protein
MLTSERMPTVCRQAMNCGVSFARGSAPADVADALVSVARMPA